MRNAISLKAPFLLTGATLSVAQQQPARLRIVPMPHFNFQVRDIEDSRHFYKDCLGYCAPFDIVKNGKLVMALTKLDDREYVEISPEKYQSQARFVHLGARNGRRRRSSPTPEVKMLSGLEDGGRADLVVPEGCDYQPERAELHSHIEPVRHDYQQDRVDPRLRLYFGKEN